jgi:hypothetical protein
MKLKMNNLKMEMGEKNGWGEGSTNPTLEQTFARWIVEIDMSVGSNHAAKIKKMVETE